MNCLISPGIRKERPSGRSQAAILFVAVLAFSRAGEAADCSSSALEKVRRLSQQVNPAVEEPARSMITSCPGTRDEAWVWLAAYYRARREYGKAAELASLLPGASVGAERDRVLFEATRGDWASLEGRIDRGEPGFGGDAESLLVLARAQVRAGEFEKARARYAQYLAIKPDDRGVAIEAAYSFLWEGRPSDAESKFKELLAKESLSDSQRGLLEDGVQRSFSMEETTQRYPLDTAPPALDFSTEIASTTFYGFSRTSSGLGYRGPEVGARALVHWLSSSKPGADSFGAVEGRVSYGKPVREDFSVRGALGAFATGRTLVTGELVGDWRLKRGFGVFGGFYREALAKDVPLSRDLSDRALAAFFLGFRLRQVLEYRYEARSLGGFTRSSKHVAQTKLGLRKASGAGAMSGNLALGLGAESESFGAASTWVYSPRSATAFKASLLYDADFGSGYSGSIRIDYGQVFESAAAGGLSFGSSATLLGAGAELGYRLGETLMARLRLRFDRTQGETGATTYGASVLGLGLSWALGGGER